MADRNTTLNGHGCGVTADREEALTWLQAAGDRGEILAMRRLVALDGSAPDASEHLSENEGWSAAAAETDKLKQRIT